MLVLLIVFVVYVLCGVLAYGISFAFYQNKYPGRLKQDYKADKIHAVAVGCTGVFGFVAVLAVLGVKYGIKFK